MTMNPLELVFPILVLAAIVAANSWLFHINARKWLPLWARAAFHILNIAGGICFAIHFITDRSVGIAAQKTITGYAYLWMYAVCNGLMAAVAAEAVYAICRRAGHGYERKYSLVAVTAAVAALFVVGHINYKQIRTIAIDFEYDGKDYVLTRCGELEPGMDDAADSSVFRLVFASDIHLGDGLGPGRLETFVGRINDLRPDAVVFGGDLLNKGAVIPAADSCPQILRRLRAPQGVYGIYGNHEYYAEDTAKVSEFYRESGIRILRDSSAVVGGRVFVSGIDDEGNAQRDTLFPRNERIPQGMFSLGVSHRPDNLDLYDSLGYDFSICGHTHNGQFFPGNLLLKIERKHASRGRYTYGLFRLPQGSQGFVSCGLGIWGPHFRTFSRSEIVLLRIRGQQEINDYKRL